MKSVLIGKKHASDDFVLIAGPEVATSDQIAIRAKIAEAHPINDIWEEVHMWMENPIKGKLKFVTKEQHEDAAAARKVADAELESSRHEAEERQAKFDREAEEAAKKKHAEELERLNKFHAETITAQEPINKAQIEKRAAGQLPKDKK
jgi:hypothetical protein